MPVRAKKALTPRRSIRYLLYADRTLRRISLRRIAVGAKKTTKSSTPRRVKKTASRATTRSRKAINGTPLMSASRARALRGMDPWWVAFGVVCAVGIVAMIGIPNASQRAGRTDTVADGNVNLPREDASVAPLDTVKPASRSSAAGAAARTRTPDAPAPGVLTVDAAHTPSADSTTTNGQAVAGAEVQAAGLVTIQGCLQAGDNTFWLKDTSGADAPKARSWKSGFLKKRSTSVEVVDASNALRLSKYVSQRVAATGTGTDGTMHARRR